MNKLSVVIPCKNEKQWISICIDALLEQKVGDSSLEIIVVDNGSTDGTIDILRSYGSQIRYLDMPVATISELRNYGVQQSQGDWLAFIDSDVEVRVDWFTDLIRTIRELHQRGDDQLQVVIGSTYLLPGSPSWVERTWFQQLVARDLSQTNYINGGNLILSKQFFERIGGFAPEYYTGEDVRFCQDALSKGGKIIKVKDIQVIHHGYPKTIRDFFRRERWHGLGMKHFLLRPWKMKDLMLALYFSGATALFLVLMLFVGSVRLMAGIWFIILMLPIFVFAILRSKGRPGILFPLTFLYFIYGWARVFSLVDILRGRRSR